MERIPPSKLTASISGDDKGSASNVGATFSAELEPAGEGTRVAYRVEYSLRGRLGTFGSAVLQGTVRKMTAEFASCLEKALTPG
jgi:carbon monoxide dehydrogenase subunit G